MSVIRRRQIVDTDIQRKIITGMIVSTEFCRDVIPMIEKDYFSGYIKRVIYWVTDYYKRYQQAPKKHIQDIYEVEKENLQESEAQLIETFLFSLSSEYEKISFNVDYYLDEAEKFFKKKGIDLLAKKIEVLVGMGKVNKAEELVRDYKKIARVTSRWVNPFSDEFVEKVIMNEEENFFTLPGKLGQMVGSLERGWFVLVVGPEKRGKTWYLGEMAILGILSNLNVAYMTAEMNEKKISYRLYQRLMACGDEDGNYVYPVFDCKKNQNGVCKMKQRTNDITLLEEGNFLKFETKMKYRPCTYCRENKIQGYIPATWFVAEKRAKFSHKRLRRKIKGLERVFGDRLRIICYPRFEATTEDIERDLDNLEYTENFVPDIIITDYADIFKCPDGRLMGRDALDYVYKMLANMASKRHVLLFSGSQARADTLITRSVRAYDVAEDKRKLAHIDVGLFLSQTDKEKNKGVMRVSMFHRYKNFSESKQIQVLQMLDRGQVILDSEYCWKEE